MPLYVNFGFLELLEALLLEEVGKYVEILGVGGFLFALSAILVQRIYNNHQEFQRQKQKDTHEFKMRQQESDARIKLIEAETAAKLKETDHQSEANQVATISNLANGLMTLFTELTKTLQVMQTDVKTTAAITPAATAHYAAAAQHHDATLVHQNRIEPMIVNLKNVVDRTDLKVGEIDAKIGEVVKLSGLTQTLYDVANEINERVNGLLHQHQSQQPTAIEATVTIMPTESAEPKDAPQPLASESSEPAPAQDSEAAK
jgi:hypothetical protein